MKTLFLSLALLLPTFVSAQSVDILYTGVNYTPPFYRGGSLWSQEGSLMFLAVPQGLGNPANLNYKWTKDGTVLGSVSGIGQNALYSNDPLFSKPQTVKVEIVAPDDTIVASASVSVTPIKPIILVYEKHPLYGFLFNQEASPNYRLTGPETTFAAFPLFFSTTNRENSSVNYSWKSSAGEDSAVSTVTYRIPENSSGQASISVKAANPASIRQMADKSFLVQFGNEN